MQSVLTSTIQIIFISFVTLMIWDFINGLFALHFSPTTEISFTQPEKEEFTPSKVAITTPQFEQLPDPWQLELAPSYNVVSESSIVLPFPSLRLLPPAKEVQPKPKRKTSTNQASSTASNQKTTSTKAARKPGRPRKEVAA